MEKTYHTCSHDKRMNKKAPLTLWSFGYRVKMKWRPIFGHKFWMLVQQSQEKQLKRIWFPQAKIVFQENDGHLHAAKYLRKKQPNSTQRYVAQSQDWQMRCEVWFVWSRSHRWSEVQVCKLRRLWPLWNLWNRKQLLEADTPWPNSRFYQDKNTCHSATLHSTTVEH